MDPKPKAPARRPPMLPGAGDPSIRARKQQLFEADERPALASEPGKPFAQYLRETPAAPLPLGIKAALGVAGLIVAALLVAAFLRLNAPRKPKGAATGLVRPASAILALSDKFSGLPAAPARSLG